jgi:hypothetical protein
LYLGENIAMLTQDQYVKGKLVEMGWRFGQSYAGGHIAGEMVMQTLANRVRVGWGSWLQIIDRVPLFMAENEIPKLEHPNIWEPNFVKLLHVVDGIFDNSIPDKSKGALYWGDLARIERPWFLEKIVQGTKENFEGVLIPAHQRVATLNGLCFFK